MSAVDLQRRPARMPSGGGPPSGLKLRPEPIAEKSFMESMAGFIHEVVPQSYGGWADVRDPVLWARVEHLDLNTYQTADSCENGLPLLLVLGYAAGVQLWTVLASGEAREVLSWRQGTPKIFRLLPSPEQPEHDRFASQRPLVAVCESCPSTTSSTQPVTFLSLRTGETVKTIRFKSSVCDVLANSRFVVVTFSEKVAVFNAATLDDELVLTNCYPASGPCVNPCALGSRWLAYAEKRLLPIHRGGGGFEGEGIQSYTATVIHAAKTLGKGLRDFGGTFASSLSGQRAPASSPSFSASSASSLAAGGGGCSSGAGVGAGGRGDPQPGVVTVLDLEGVAKGGPVNLAQDQQGVVAHFVAHANSAISYLAFDPSGSLLFTADRQGHQFNIFRILPAPCATKQQSAVHHLYTLYRGDTTAKVQDVTFSTDCRWVAVTTLRATTHLFPITPYGGPVGVRTHASCRVVNRLSRFHRSAGLDDVAPPSGRNSPILLVAGATSGATCGTASLSGSAPGSSLLFGSLPSAARSGGGSTSASASSSDHHHHHHHLPALFPFPNPRLPPYPQPTIMSPLAQLRSSYLANAAAVAAAGSGSRFKCGGGAGDDYYADAGALRVACCFAAPRGAATLASSLASNVAPTLARERLQRKAPESLFVMSCHGTLVEYALEPRIASGIGKERACDESPIELEVTSCAQWAVCRPPHAPDLTPPLSADVLDFMMRGLASDSASSSSSSTAAVLDVAGGAESSSVAGVLAMGIAADVAAGVVAAETIAKTHATQETWLAQVEINTHAGPHRRLWMGPQFTFKTIKRDSSSSLADIEASDADVLSRPARSNPVNMPETDDLPIQGLPVITGQGSASSYEQSPRLLLAHCSSERDPYSPQRCDSDTSVSDAQLHQQLLLQQQQQQQQQLQPARAEVELQLRENLADAMLEVTPTAAAGAHLAEENSHERRTHYFMDDDRLPCHWPPPRPEAPCSIGGPESLLPPPPPAAAAASLSIEEDLLDFDLESESMSDAPLVIAADDKFPFVSAGAAAAAAAVPVSSTDADASCKSAGESSNEDDIVTVESGDPFCRKEKSRRKNRKKK